MTNKGRTWLLKGLLLLYNVLRVVIPIQEQWHKGWGWGIEKQKQAFEFIHQLLVKVIGPPPTPPGN